MTTTRPTCGTCGSDSRAYPVSARYPTKAAWWKAVGRKRCKNAFHDAPKPGAESEEFEDDPTAGETEG